MKKAKLMAGSIIAAGIMAGTTLTSFAATQFQQPSYPKYTKNVTITWWSWTTNANNVIKAFNKVYPNIHVKHPQIGQGSKEYTKLQTAIKAGSGAPDVVQIEYQYIPKFVDTGGLANISKYVNQFKGYFQPWTWNQVSRDGKVYAVPEDIGPLSFYYRPDIFKKYNLKVPKTYQDMEVDAAKLHKADPNMYYTYFPENDPGWFTAMLWQAGAQPFKDTPNGWEIDINSATAKKVANYWGDMIKKGYIKVANDWTPQWESDIGKGEFASLVGAAWSPSYMLQPYVKPSTSNWNAADTPQWNAGQFVNGNWGGSTNAVTTQSKHPKAAALFAAWINTSQAGNKLSLTPDKQGGRGLFPADKYATDLPQFSAPNKGLSNQVVAPILTKAANAVDTSFQWSPWTDYVYQQMTTEFTKAAQGKETWNQALDTVQKNTVSFAKTAGYKVVSAPAKKASGSTNNQTTASSSNGSHFSPAWIVFIVIIVLALGIFALRRFRRS